MLWRVAKSERNVSEGAKRHTTVKTTHPATTMAEHQIENDTPTAMEMSFFSPSLLLNEDSHIPRLVGQKEFSSLEQ